MNRVALALLAGVAAAVVIGVWVWSQSGSSPSNIGANSVPATAAAPSSDLPARLASADPQQGRLLFLSCGACHGLGDDGTPMAGPHLAELFGRRAGSVPGYDYSPMMQVQSFSWTPEILDQWLRDPVGFLPDSRMRFLPINDPQDRAHLIAFLQSATIPHTPPEAVDEAARPGPPPSLPSPPGSNEPVSSAPIRD
jgi:cytochrome c